MNLFNIDFKRLALLLLPVALRKPNIYALVKVCFSPLVTLFDVFTRNRNTNRYRLNVTPQICHLRRMLNDFFDPELRGVVISDGDATNWLMLHPSVLFSLEGGKQPIWVGFGEVQADRIIITDGVKLAPRQGNVGYSGLDFYVLLPSRVRPSADLNRVSSLVNTYKLASKRYAISFYN